MANIKRHKGVKGATIAICAIGTVALVSVGFATWVITGGSTADASGTIKVDVVSDSSYTIELGDWKDSKGSIVFGIPNLSSEEYSGSSDTHASWLSIDGDDYENLSVTKYFKIYNVSEGTNLNNLLSVEFSITSEEVTWTNLTSYQNKYVSGLPNTTDGTLYFTFPEGSSSGESLSSSNVSSDAYGTYTECSVTAKFSWGDAFNGMNPYFYSALIEEYETTGSLSDGSSFSSDNITTQIAFSNALKTVYDELNNLTYQITIIAAGGTSSGDSGN